MLVSVGKAAWQMARAAVDELGADIDEGIVITKYGHSKGPLNQIRIFEAGHPVPDENSYQATEQALELVSSLTENDTILLLLSGGGSALFEKPLINPRELQQITKALLTRGASITQMNTVRKRFSGVKGGRFAEACAPAYVFSIILSDIIGDPLDMIASGPACPDSSTCEDAAAIAAMYELELSPEAQKQLRTETPKELTNVTSMITGSVKQLCLSAKEACETLGYEAVILTDSLCCTARDAGRFLGSIARFHNDTDHSLAFIAGGETVVHVTGTGLGGRNQEIALSAAQEITGIHDVAVFSLGSDGTDGPTDAAGGYVDTTTVSALAKKGFSIPEVLRNNDAYHALEACGGLLMTGPTGTNVNDLSVVLIKRKSEQE